MPNAVFRDFSISEPNVVLGSVGEFGTGVTVSVRSEATGSHRDKLREFFDGLVRLSDMDLRAVEAVVSRLVNAEAEEAGKTIETLVDEDNRRIRDRFIAERAPLRRDDVLRIARKSGPDSETVLHLWEAEGAVFSVIHHGKAYYPDFQFRDDRPVPIVKDLIAALPSDFSDWQRAFWFVSANGWVHDRAPADHLDEATLLLQAARYEGEPVIG